MKHLLLLFLVVCNVKADIEHLDFSSDNTIENINLESTTVIQGSLYSYRGNINSSDIDFKSEFRNSTLDSNSSVTQNVFLLDNSSMEESSIISHSVIDGLIGHTSLVRQSIININNGTNIANNSEIILKNNIHNIRMDRVEFLQGEIYMSASEMKDSKLISHNSFLSRMGNSVLQNASVTQGAYVVANSNISNSTLETQSILLDTEVNRASLDICSTYITSATLSNVHMKKKCFMKDSTIRNGARLSYGITRI